MLQQTRVEAVLPYYQRFLSIFPTLDALALAPETDVLAAWSGLGYYSRARNLHRAAKMVAQTGVPSTLEGVRALPGVGPYTAAAIASISLGLPYAAVDGNVVRVVSRLTNGLGNVPETAEKLLDRARPGDFNQAMMELGATVCVPGNPACGACPVTQQCQAFAAGTARELPVKIKKKAGPDVEIDVVVLERNGSVFLVERGAGERRMAGFWELPQLLQFPRLNAAPAHEFTHQIVNQRHLIRVWRARTPKRLPEGRWVQGGELRSIPLTTIARKSIDRLQRECLT